MAEVSGRHGHADHVRDIAIVTLMIETGLSSAEVAALDLSQLKPSDPDRLRTSPSAELTGISAKGRSSRTVPLDEDSRTSIAFYLQQRRIDAENGSTALFVAAASDSTGKAGDRLSADSVDAIVGGECNLRVVTTVPGAAVPGDVLDQIRQLTSIWATSNGCSRALSARVVATTYEVAVSALHGPKVMGSPARAVYLIVLEGDFVMRQALGTHTLSRPTKSWAALIVNQSPPLQVGGFVLRPDPPDNFGLEDLGHVHSMTL